MANRKIISSTHEVPEGNIRSYTIGFGISVGLTALAFGIIMSHAVSGVDAIVAVVTLAIIQLFVQVKFFLHLGRGQTRRWNQLVFGFMLMVVVIVVSGSLWIMRNLDYHHDTRTSQQIDSDISHDENISR